MPDLLSVDAKRKHDRVYSKITGKWNLRNAALAWDSKERFSLYVMLLDFRIFGFQCPSAFDVPPSPPPFLPVTYNANHYNAVRTSPQGLRHEERVYCVQISDV